MRRTAKIIIVLFCFSLCGVSSFVASNAREKVEPQRINATPVKNRGNLRRVWTVAALYERRMNLELEFRRS
jgi:hypothetical protein